MGKIMKPNKVVLILSGRYAGRKAMILKNHDEGTSDRAYSNAVVAGIDRYPRPIKNRMSKTKRVKRNKIKPFIKTYNYVHLMPTRYAIDIPLNKGVLGKDVCKDPLKRKKALRDIKASFESSYKEGKYRWFFKKLQF